MNRRDDKTLAVILAAGQGSRFQGPQHKLHTRLADGRTLADHAITNAVRSQIGPVVVVTGATELDLPETLTAAITLIDNPHWIEGQATSLQIAIAQARPHITAIVVGLADQPSIEPTAWRLVANATSPISHAVYQPRGLHSQPTTNHPPSPRHPVRLDRTVWGELPVTGDSGARHLIAQYPELVTSIMCPGSAVDIDTTNDLASHLMRETGLT